MEFDTDRVQSYLVIFGFWRHGGRVGCMGGRLARADDMREPVFWFDNSLFSPGVTKCSSRP